MAMYLTTPCDITVTTIYLSAFAYRYCIIDSVLT